MVDTKVFANGSKALKHKRAFGRYTGALTVIDFSTWFKIGKLIRSHASLEVELEALRVGVHSAGHTLQVLRLDNEFVPRNTKRSWSYSPASPNTITALATYSASTRCWVTPTSRAGILAATTAEIKSIGDMETWESKEALSAEQIELRKRHISVRRYF